MKLTRASLVRVRSLQLRKRNHESGLSLIEMAVALGVGSIVLVVVGLLSLYGLRSFAVMGSLADLDEHSRLAVDRISREVRQTTGVLRYQTSSTDKTLVLTNALTRTYVAYVWDAETRTLTYEQTGEPGSVCLTDCEFWDVRFFQDQPQASATMPFLRATNGTGQLDLGLARIVAMSWKCSRAVPGMKVNAESTQSLQIVLRNSPQ